MAEQQSSMAEQQSSQPPINWQPRRSKLAWRALLIFNLSMGAYIFSRPRKKETGAASRRKALAKESKESKLEEEVRYEMVITPEPAIEPVKVQDPITEDQQRELFNWMLEEKRKVEPRDREEKKRIDEDKAVLKRVIREKSIPRF